MSGQDVAPGHEPGPERAALVERIAEAMRATREFRAGAAFGIPPDARVHCSTGLAEATLTLLESEGRLADPHHERCRHHDGFCGAIAVANGDLGEALVEASAEIERLGGLLADAEEEVRQLTDALGRKDPDVRTVMAYECGMEDGSAILERLAALADTLEAEAARVDEYRGDGATETDNRIIDQAVRIHREHAATLREVLS